LLLAVSSIVSLAVWEEKKLPDFVWMPGLFAKEACLGAHTWVVPLKNRGSWKV